MNLSLSFRPAHSTAHAAQLAALLTLSHSAVDAVASMPAALLPTLLVAVLSFSGSVTQPLFGALADRLGARRVVIGGSILTSAVLSLIGVAPSAAMLALLFLIGGFGSAAYHPAGASLARAAGTQHRGLVLSLFAAGGTVGLALGPLLVISVLATYGLGATPWLMLPGLLLAALLAATASPAPPAPQSRRRMGLRSLPKAVWLLALAGILESLAFVTFMNGMPLWLVSQGVAADSPLIGWALAAFALAAAAGGIVAGALAGRLPAIALVGGSMLLALLPLLGLFALAPGTALFFGAVVLAGALMHAGFPVLVVRAQDLAPEAVATASGMIMGFATGVAGLLYIGVGYLQEVLGIGLAMRLAFLSLVPAALLAGLILRRLSSLPGPPATQDSATQDCRCEVCCYAGSVVSALGP